MGEQWCAERRGELLQRRGMPAAQPAPMHMQSKARSAQHAQRTSLIFCLAPLISASNATCTSCRVPRMTRRRAGGGFTERRGVCAPARLGSGNAASPLRGHTQGLQHVHTNGAPRAPHQSPAGCWPLAPPGPNQPMKRHPPAAAPPAEWRRPAAPGSAAQRHLAPAAARWAAPGPAQPCRLRSRRRRRRLGLGGGGARWRHCYCCSRSAAMMTSRPGCHAAVQRHNCGGVACALLQGAAVVVPRRTPVQAPATAPSVRSLLDDGGAASASCARCCRPVLNSSLPSTHVLHACGVVRVPREGTRRGPRSAGPNGWQGRGDHSAALMRARRRAAVSACALRPLLAACSAACRLLATFLGRCPAFLEQLMRGHFKSQGAATLNGPSARTMGRLL